MLSVASVVTVARAAPAPSALNDICERCHAPTRIATPTMPLQVIITAANTVSRASELVSPPPPSIRVTISATSITVTATASTNEPKGSPTRWATTSAWCTAARTDPASSSVTTTTATPARSRPQAIASTAVATTGMTTVQDR